MTSDPRSYISLLAHTVEMLAGAFDDDDLLATLDDRDEWPVLSRRLPELATEQVQALEVLCDEEMWRPAHALLRGLLECMATIVWIARGPTDAPGRFAAGRSPGSQKLLAAVGWHEEYDRTFRPLSDMAHPSVDGAEAYRWFDEERSIHAPAPEITPDLELYLVGAPSDEAVAVPVRALSAEELREEYEPYLAAKAFDLVISALAVLYGEERCRAAPWWPRDALVLFALCLRNRPTVRERILWSGPEATGAWPQLALTDDQA
jgi:PAS domain-containing protein